MKQLKTMIATIARDEAWIGRPIGEPNGPLPLPWLATLTGLRFLPPPRGECSNEKMPRTGGGGTHDTLPPVPRAGFRGEARGL